MSSSLQPPHPPPGPPFIPSSFSTSSTRQETEGYVFNHVALQIHSAASSLSFYVDLLGMSLVFVLNAGPFTAYYLGYPAGEDDITPADMARTTGTRSGLLELILVNDDADMSRENPASPLNGTNASEGGMRNHQESKRDKQSTGQRRATGTGFAHLGFRVPDVGETMRRAEERGWKIMKDIGDTNFQRMYLPGWEPQNRRREWEGGFENVFGQIGFVEDPDGNWIEILPRELKR